MGSAVIGIIPQRDDNRGEPLQARIPNKDIVTARCIGSPPLDPATELPPQGRVVPMASTPRGEQWCRDLDQDRRRIVATFAGMSTMASASVRAFLTSLVAIRSVIAGIFSRESGTLANKTFVQGRFSGQ